MFKTEVTTCYSLITLLRYYGKVLSPFLLRYYAITARPILSPSFLLRYYGITARYFTLLFYWHQSYCKSKCFVLTTLLRKGTLLFFLIGIKATVKASVSSFLRCYAIMARYSTLFIGIKATVNTSVSFLLRYHASTARFFTLLSSKHQSYCKKQVFHSYYAVTLLRQGTSLFFVISIKATIRE